MKRRTIGLGVLAGVVLAAGLAAGCSSGGGKEGLGTLNVPLLTHGPSGTAYRLRNATFEISSSYYYYDDYGYGGDGGSSTPPITVSSEDDPDAPSIAVSVERGSYYVRLLPGWHLEKIDDTGAVEVEATLLSEATQWVYVYQHSSTWIAYEFGLGDRSLWFNGELNIDIVVHEDPSEIYGGGGLGGASGEPGLAGAGGT